MEFHKEKTLEETVNTRGTKLWIMMNDSSKAVKHRSQFLATHGGFFTKTGRYWNWTNPIAEKNGYWLKRVDTGEKTFFKDMSQFAESQGMTSVKICELLNGKRKTYKGWTAVEIREVKDGIGSHEKLEEPKAKTIMTTKLYILVDTTTNIVLTIPNLSQFAKQNSLDYSALKKLVNGKAKTYKNLKVYNPLEKYKHSQEPK
jgi:hypothetical protein